MGERQRPGTDAVPGLCASRRDGHCGRRLRPRTTRRRADDLRLRPNSTSVWSSPGSQPPRVHVDAAVPAGPCVLGGPPAGAAKGLAHRWLRDALEELPAADPAPAAARPPRPPGTRGRPGHRDDRGPRCPPARPPRRRPSGHHTGPRPPVRAPGRTEPRGRDDVCTGCRTAAPVTNPSNAPQEPPAPRVRLGSPS